MIYKRGNKLANYSLLAIMLAGILLWHAPVAFADNVLTTVTDQFANAMQS